MKARRFLVFGRVQGVAFRYFTRREARALGLVGFVRNCSDGSVEAEAWGSGEALEKFRHFLDHGSPAARVERVEEAPPEGRERPHSFEIRP